MKRKIFIAALAVLSLFSCRKDESLGLSDTDDAIGFSPYMERVSTKAAVTDVTSSNLTSFKVMSYLQDTSIVYFTSEVTATKQASSGLYTTSDTYYWPTNSGLDFFAYSGSGAGAIRNTKGVAALTYKVPAAGDEDFVVAKAEDCTKASATDTAGMKAQPLTFSHALSKVNSVTLKAKQDGVGNTSNYRFIITDVSIKEAKNSATYMFNPTEGGNWGPADGDTTYAFTASNFTAENGYFPGSSSKTLECSGSTADQLIILPQTAKFSITYSVQYSPDGTGNWMEVMGSTTETVGVPMGMGKSYDITFVLSINTSPVTFILSSVDSWAVTRMPAEYWEGGTNYGPGTLVNGVVWAPVNCGIGANSKYPYGLMYQWGRSEGLPYEGEEGTVEFVDGKTYSPEAGKFYRGEVTPSLYSKWVYDCVWYAGETFTEWPMTSPSNGIGNPCPDGWRVPTIDELGNLFFDDWNGSLVGPYVQRGYYTVGKGWYIDGLFFPASGEIRRNKAMEGVYCDRDVHGYYASSSFLPSIASSSDSMWCVIYFGVEETPEMTTSSQYCQASANTIRCVQE